MNQVDTTTNTPVASSAYLKADEAAKYLNVCKRTFMGWVSRGYFSRYKVGRCHRYAKADLDKGMLRFKT